jgi:hypothetical protein
MSRIARFLYGWTLFQFDLAIAAIAAAVAPVTQMVRTGVFGTRGADASGFLAADTAVERHFSYVFLS